jgi:hypothetical protein
MLRHPAPLLIVLLPCTAAMALEPADTTRICLAPAVVEASTGSAASAGDAVRETFSSFLTGPTLGVQPLSSRLSSQVHTEAKQANCQYLLLTTVKQQHKSGSHILGRAAGEAVHEGAWRAAGSVGSTAGSVVASAAAGAANGAVWDMSSTVKAHDELSLSYRLENADGNPLIEKTDKGKASSDGEDLLTPLAQRAAEAVASAVSTGH